MGRQAGNQLEIMRKIIAEHILHGCEHLVNKCIDIGSRSRRLLPRDDLLALQMKQDVLLLPFRESDVVHCFQRYDHRPRKGKDIGAAFDRRKAVGRNLFSLPYAYNRNIDVQNEVLK